MEPGAHAESLAQSPFAIPLEDVQQLLASDGFQLLRTYLANHAEYAHLPVTACCLLSSNADRHVNSFCTYHSSCDADTRDTWLLHRDLLHAVVMPVVELYRRAEVLASAALCTAKSEDLELAFAGEARGAFLWLQCFVAEDEQWCRTKGCPGMYLPYMHIAMHVLSS